MIYKKMSLILLLIALSVFGVSYSIKDLAVMSEEIYRSKILSAEDVAEYAIDISCELSSEPNSVTLNLFNSYEYAVDSLILTINGLGCLSLLSTEEVIYTDIAVGEDVSTMWEFELLCDSIPSCFEIDLISVFISYDEDTATGEVDTVHTREIGRVFGCATDTDCSSFGVVAEYSSPLPGDYVAYEYQPIIMTLYDEVGDNIVDTTVVFVLNYTDTFQIGGFNLILSEPDSILVFSPLGWRSWENAETVHVELIAAGNSRGSGLNEPLEFDFIVDLRPPVLFDIEPPPDGTFNIPFPRIEFDIYDSLSGLNESSLNLQVGTHRYTLASPSMTMEGTRVTFNSPVSYREGDRITIRITAVDSPDHGSPNTLSRTYQLTGADFCPWPFQIEPVDGDIVACEGQDISFRIEATSELIESSIDFFIVRGDTIELNTASPGVSYSAASGIITYTPDPPLENAESVTVCVVNATDSEGRDMEISPICWSFVMDLEPPLAWDNYPADGETILTSRPEISWKMWDPGFGMENITFNLTIHGIPFRIGHPAFEIFPDESLVVFSSYESGIDLIGGDTVDIIVAFHDEATLCDAHYDTLSWRFFIQGGGPLASVVRPRVGDISSCLNEYFAFGLVDSVGVDTNTIAIRVNGTEIEWADGGFIYDEDEEMLYYIPDSLENRHHNIELFRARDIIGNSLLFPVSTSFIYDTHAPEIWDLYPDVDEVIIEQQPVISFRYRDNLSGVHTERSKMFVNGIEYPLRTSDPITLTDSLISFSTEAIDMMLYGGDSVEVRVKLYDHARSYESIGDWEGEDCPANLLDTIWTFSVYAEPPTVEIDLMEGSPVVACSLFPISFSIHDSLVSIDEASILVAISRPDHDPAIHDTFDIESDELAHDPTAGNRYIFTSSIPFSHAESALFTFISVSDLLGNVAEEINRPFLTDLMPPIVDTLYPEGFLATTDTSSVCFTVSETVSPVDLGASILVVTSRGFYLDNEAITFEDSIFCFNPSVAGITWTDSSEYTIDLTIYDTPDYCDANFASYSWVLNTNFSAVSEAVQIPKEFVLQQNHPNPFNPYTIISFDVPKAGELELAVYDVVGRKIAVLADGYHEPGSYSVRFDAGDLGSGVYFYTLSHNFGFEIKRMILLK